MAGLWMQPRAELERSPVSNSIQWGWVGAAIVLFAVAAFVLLPTIQLA